MKGGIGYSWFNLTLVDETKNHRHLEGVLNKQIELQGECEDLEPLIGTIKEQVKEGTIKEHYLIGAIKQHNLTGTIKEYHLIGTLGGDEVE